MDHRNIPCLASGWVILTFGHLNADTCFVMMYNINAGGGMIYKTVDGGTTWTQNSTAGMYSQGTSFGNVDLLFLILKMDLPWVILLVPVLTNVMSFILPTMVVQLDSSPCCQHSCFNQCRRIWYHQLVSAVGSNIWFCHYLW